MSDKNDLLEPQDSEELETESENSEEEERSIDLQVLIREFALDGFVADESWLLTASRKPFAGDHKVWSAMWSFQRCFRLAIHYKLPNDPEGVDFSSRFHARYFSLPVNKELWVTLCEQETQSARRQRRDPDDIRTQKVLANEDARTFLVDQHIASLWQSGQSLPPRSELTTTESIKRLQTAIRARRFRRAKRDENPEAV